MNKIMRELIHEINDIENKIEEAGSQGRKLLNNDKIEEARAKVKEVEELKNKSKELKEQLEIESKKLEEEKKLPEEKGGINMENKIIQNAIYPDEKLFSNKNKYENNEDLDFGKMVKGMTGKGWKDAQKEQEYVNMNTSGNEVVIPHKLADYILDIAREKSALFGKIPTVVMESNNLTVAVQTKDAEAHFVKEGELIRASEVVFDKVDLKGKTLAIYIPVTEQLLDSSNISTQLTQSVANALVNAFDKALIYGNGEDSIIGLENLESVKKIEHATDTDNYDFVVAGTKAIKKANIKPTNIVYNSDTASMLEIAKTKDGQYLERPNFMNNYNVEESNNIKEDQAVIYDVNSLLLGINRNMTISWGYTGDDFQRLKKGLRIHIRADFTPVRKDGVALVNIVKS